MNGASNDLITSQDCWVGYISRSSETTLKLVVKKVLKPGDQVSMSKSGMLRLLYHRQDCVGVRK